MNSKRRPSLTFLSILLTCSLLSACTSDTPPGFTASSTIPITDTPATSTVFPALSDTPTPFQAVTNTDLPATTLAPSATPSPKPLPTLTPTLEPAAWESMPVIPKVSQAVQDIYAHGQALGNDPHAFSKIGDCETAAPWFLSNFDQKPDRYSLGSYTDLEPVIQQFSGSFKRDSLASRIGFNAASVLNPIWSDPKSCKPDEAPLACEYRVHRPSYAFILLGTNDVYHAAAFEANLRKVIEYSIQQGVVPILATKADNQEGDHSINQTIARLAYEYNLPLWNFWLAVQPLPTAGLQPDQIHLTWAPNFFDVSENMKSAWPIRNLTALQTLKAIWQGVSPH